MFKCLWGEWQHPLADVTVSEKLLELIILKVIVSLVNAVYNSFVKLNNRGGSISWSTSFKKENRP